MYNKRLEDFLRKAKENGPAIGTSVSTSDSMISEALAICGFDAVWIDTEHTPSDKREVLSHITAVQGAGKAAFVRVPWNDPVLVKPILDIGPDGIIFPMVSSAEEAKKAAASVCYPPVGCRGYGPLRANGYGADSNYIKHSRDSLLCIVMIETIQGVDSIDEICSVPGIDGVLLGGMDLSASIGNLGEIHSESFKAAIQKVCSAAKQHGVLVGCCAPDDEQSREMYISAGVDFYLASGDLAMLTGYARKMLESFDSLKMTSKK